MLKGRKVDRRGIHGSDWKGAMVGLLAHRDWPFMKEGI